MKSLERLMNPAILLGLGAFVGLGLVTALHDTAQHQIADNERADLLKTLEATISPDRFDNDLLNDVITLEIPDLHGKEPVTVYRARKQGQPSAALLVVTAPNGYGGAIRLLVTVDPNGVLYGVRVISHRETPGLGDLIETGKSDWIHRFDHRSLDNPQESHWKVKRDGGDFDQFAGATITPRAIVNTVRDTLKYFKTHQPALFRAMPEKTAP